MLPAFLFCLFLGWLGAHRFYVNKPGTAFLQIVLCGFGIGWIWVLIDLVMIVTGNFKDSHGDALTEWVE